MGSFGQIELKAIWAMLDRCAPGYTKETREHNFCIRYRGNTYPRLPRGEHKKQNKNPQIQMGHVRQMIRQLQLDEDCCRGFIRL